MAEKKRIVWIDQLRGLAFYTVILGHMSIGKDLKTWLYSFHMPLFFMISGLNLNVQRIYETSFKTYFLRLAKKMLVPYFWLQMLSFLLRYIVNIAGSHKEVPVPGHFLGMIAGNNNIVGAPSNPLYYVLLLFLAQIGLWFVIKIAKANKAYIAAILTVLAVGSLIFEDMDMPWHINVVPAAMLLIFVGRLLMDCYLFNREKLEKMNKGAYLLGCVGLFVVGYVLSRFNGRISIHGNYYGRDFVIFLVCAVATSVAIALVVMLLPENRLVKFIGMNTFFYMGIHKPLLLVFEELAGSFEDHWLFLLLGSLVCFFGLAPFALVAEKYFPYVCGNETTTETKLISRGRYLAVAAAWAVPYLYFCNHFMDGVLRSTFAMQLVAAAVYIVAVVTFTFLAKKFFPFVFLKKETK